VPVEGITTGTICETVSITGELVPEKSAIIKPLMDGRISFLKPVKVGDSIEKGDVVAKIDDRDIEDDIQKQQQQIEISREQIRLDEEELKQMKKSLEYDRKLVASSYISRNEVEKSETNVSRAEVSLRKSVITLEQEQNMLKKFLRQREKVAIAAPISGTIVPASHLMAKESSSYSSSSSDFLEEDIMSLDDTLVGSSTPIFGILSRNGFLVQCQVTGKHQALISVGQKAKITVVSYKPIALEGTVSRISNLQDIKTKGYKVWIRPDKLDESFTSGLFARANIELQRHDNAMITKKEYIKERNNKRFVQMVKNSMIKDVPVTIGLENEGDVEICTGLTCKDSIVASKEVFAPDQAATAVVVKPEADDADTNEAE
jgi:multidrug efflux pump subunit AcrA (membrane-fusion protein)